MATIDEFHVIQMKIGKIVSAERIPGADKLLKLMVDFGETQTVNPETGETNTTKDLRQILSGIAQYYEPEALVGKSCPFVTNLLPRTLRGLESHGMILAVDIGDEAVLLHPDKEVPPGSMLR